MDKQSFINEQREAARFEIGDSVRFPIFTRGNNFAPQFGRVIAVLDGIGKVDVVTSMGTHRLPPSRLVKDNRIDTDHLEDPHREFTFDQSKARLNEADDGYTYALPFYGDSPSEGRDSLSTSEKEASRQSDLQSRVAFRHVDRNLGPVLKSASELVRNRPDLSEIGLYDRLSEMHGEWHSDSDIKCAVKLFRENR